LTWFRARGRIPCGGCVAWIAAGDLARRAATPRPFCADCARRIFAERPPRDVPEDPPPPPGPTSQPTVTRGGGLLAQAVLDFKARQGGDR
jgi:hypothetical protein